VAAPKAQVSQAAGERRRLLGNRFVSTVNFRQTASSPKDLRVRIIRSGEGSAPPDSTQNSMSDNRKNDFFALPLLPRELA
jgi:hypothetical protein